MTERIGLTHQWEQRREKMIKSFFFFCIYIPAENVIGESGKRSTARGNSWVIYLSRYDRAPCALDVSTFIDSVTSTRFRPGALIIHVKGERNRSQSSFTSLLQNILVALSSSTSLLPHLFFFFFFILFATRLSSLSKRFIKSHLFCLSLSSPPPSN